jgi:DNA-binding beta-propeller fold protein YncE
VNPDGRILYVSSFLGGTVSEIDMFTQTVLRTFFAGGTPREMALHRKGTRLYVANEQGYLNEINIETGDQTAQIPLPAGRRAAAHRVQSAGAHRRGHQRGLHHVRAIRRH